MSRYDPDRHHRTSIRLGSHDYSQAGAYFVTICTQGRQLFLQDLQRATMIQNAWNELPERFPTIMLDAFVVMPNHVHGVVWLRPSSNHEPTSKPQQGAVMIKRPVWNRRKPALGELIRTFKALSTQRIRQHYSSIGFAWQSNYYEHIIRTDESLQAIRQYIVDNPSRWHLDRYNPEIVAGDLQTNTTDDA